MSRNLFWPTVSVVLAAGSAAFVFTDIDFPLRPVFVLVFLFVCPGMALVRHLRIGGVAELTLGVALSFALDAIVPGTMLYAGAWSPGLGLLVLIVITLVATLADIARLRPGALPAFAWTWPVDGPVLRPFVLGGDPYAAGQHRGIDVGAAQGASVRAPAAGTVSFAGTVPGGGRTVTVRTTDGYSVTLAHLGSISVAQGAAVAEGDAVGTIGPTGEPEHAEPYVHLSVTRTSERDGYVDPLGLLPSREQAHPPAVSPADLGETTS
jgi:Peptidase family M23